MGIGRKEKMQITESGDLGFRPGFCCVALLQNSHVQNERFLFRSEFLPALTLHDALLRSELCAMFGRQDRSVYDMVLAPHS